MSHLRKLIGALWLFALCAAAQADDQSGVRPGDDSMTCQQIGAELAPYAQQLGVAWRPVGDTTKTLVATAQAEMARDLPKLMAMQAAAGAASATGVPGVGAAANAAMAAEQQRMAAENRAEQKPITDKLNADLEPAMAQGQAMQGNPRIQRLLTLAKEKKCH